MDNSKGQVGRYRPHVFDVDSLERAKEMILTPVHGISTEERWHIETPLVAGQIGQFLDLGKDTVVLDYGCGVGRLAKELIKRYECYVLGVDISPGMRRMAVDYVDSSRFTALSIEFFSVLVSLGLRLDHAIAVWVLQHCEKPDKDVDRIFSALKPGGRVYVLNDVRRTVPTEEGWIDDGKDIRSVLCERFIKMKVTTLPLPLSAIARKVAMHTFVAELSKDDQQNDANR